MKPAGDIHVEAARIQQAIERHLGMDGNLIFDFNNEDNQTRLDLITVNARHNQSFLFHRVHGVNKIDALEKMYAYVKSYKEIEGSFTIQWVAKGSRDLQTSYFRAKNMYDALDKLYYGRDLNSITVFSIVLNPIS